MATKNLKFLSEADRSLISDWEHAFPGSIEHIQKTGKLDPRIVSFFQNALNSDAGNGVTRHPSQIQNTQKDYSRLQQSVSKLNDPQIFRKFIEDTNKDEENLPTDSLQLRQQAFENLGDNQGEEQYFDQNSFAKEIRNSLPGIVDVGGVSNSGYDAGAQYASQALKDNKFSGQVFAETVFNNSSGDKSGKVLEAIKNKAQAVHSAFINRVNEFNKTRTVPGQDVAADVKRIQSIISGREYVDKESAKVAELERTIPGMLDTQRNRLFGDLRGSAKNYLEHDYSPRVIQELSRRGLDESGEVGAAIGDKASELFGDIERKQMDQETEEVNFWADQAYKNTFDRLIEARTEVATQVQSTRTQALDTSSKNFARNQEDITSRFNMDLFKAENERALQSYQKQVSNKQSQVRSQKEAQAVSDVASAVGTGVAMKFLG